MKKVVIIQEALPHYRIKFYRCLRLELKKYGVLLDVVHSPSGKLIGMQGSLPWSKTVRPRKFLGFTWQPIFKCVRGAELVIVQQDIKYLSNYILLIKAKFCRLKIAMWGHGKNFQSQNSNSIAERWKRIYSRQVDWWFAYNDLSAKVVSDFGFSPHKITAVQNSIDMHKIIEMRDEVTKEELRALKSELGIDSENVAIFTGRFYSIKRIKFLLESAELIRSELTDFHLIVIGDGPEQSLLNKFTSKHSWIHYVGVKTDEDKIPYWLISKVLLMPGAVGLVVLDSFALGKPMVTTQLTTHGPEIDYFTNEEQRSVYLRVLVCKNIT